MSAAALGMARGGALDPETAAPTCGGCARDASADPPRSAASPPLRQALQLADGAPARYGERKAGQLAMLPARGWDGARTCFPTPSCSTAQRQQSVSPNARSSSAAGKVSTTRGVPSPVIPTGRDARTLSSASLAVTQRIAPCTRTKRPKTEWGAQRRDLSAELCGRQSGCHMAHSGSGLGGRSGRTPPVRPKVFGLTV